MRTHPARPDPRAPGVNRALRPAEHLRSHDVAVIVDDGLDPFELGIVAGVFGSSRSDAAAPGYRLRACAAGRRPVRGEGGLIVTVAHGLDLLAGSDTVLVPGPADVDRGAPAELLDALRAASAAGARLVSLCLGAFTLAAAGLLDGHVVTTHHSFAQRLAGRYPRVEVRAHERFIDDGAVLSCAQGAAVLDLCLHMVRRDHSAVMADAVARRLLVPGLAGGPLAAAVPSPAGSAGGDRRIAEAMTWARARLGQRITVGDLAAQAFMSARTFGRHFQHATGQTPGDWLVEQRVRASLPLLETSELSVEEIATTVGFSNAAALRYHFARLMEVRPSAYRLRHRSGLTQIQSSLS